MNDRSAPSAPSDAADPAAVLPALRAAIGGTWRGAVEVVDLLLTAALAGGHVLLQDVPGVGKTTLAGAMARAIGGRFGRVQCTSDLLPGDVTGVNVLVTGSVDTVFRPGPIFANVVLADELNRTTPRTQSALLEAMAEGSVTVDGISHPLPRPFLVVATQNPYDLHGTYPLPDSQLDRFLLRLSLGYPSRDDERLVLRQVQGRAPTTSAVVDPATLLALAARVEAVRMSVEVEDHLLDLVWATRGDARLLRGVSPRGAQALHRASRALALVRGRSFVLPEDVRELAVPVLGHRVVSRTSVDGGDAVIAALVHDLPPPA
ncbi:MAG: MoxR family ATPase [Alphaproteobacteria bacterium]|nr:MoxR family ATPase [Alphaproteobacteria bacterium]